MEMLFLTASPSLLRPDGIRECSEAVKANTSKKEKKKKVGGANRGKQTGRAKLVKTKKGQIAAACFHPPHLLSARANLEKRKTELSFLLKAVTDAYLEKI